MRNLIGTVSLAATLAAAGSASGAQPHCADRATVTERLKSSYGERYVGGGIHSETAIMEVWMSEEQGTWTILMTTASGQSCVMATGTHWRAPLPSDTTPPGTRS